jgi:hypothetical protein
MVNETSSSDPEFSRLLTALSHTYHALQQQAARSVDIALVA